jgi:hypothetical protein
MSKADNIYTDWVGKSSMVMKRIRDNPFTILFIYFVFCCKYNILKLTAVGYRVNIIQPHLIHAIDRQLELFQQDNARLRQAPLSMDYLEQNKINALF